ncbi:MAG TPA: D-hexose-6-phosphate mutarotase [Verrucomicrobiae bacterium]
MANNLDALRRHEIPGRIAVTAGQGGLAKLVVTTPVSTAELYLNGAHVTHFQKTGEAPLIFMSRKSYFAPGKAIRGGVPICYPWFGNRDGEPSHGFVRSTEWQLVKTSAAADGSVTLQLAVPAIPGREAWKHLRTEFIVTVGATLTMELLSSNESCGETVELEECLHTYFQVSDASAVSVHGLEKAGYQNYAAGDTGSTQAAEGKPVTFDRETNRTYFNTTDIVELRDPGLKRVIRVAKSNSLSTVVWNPWTTQKLPDDFDPAEYRQMVCVESGNVRLNKLTLAPGKSAQLKVVISSSPLVA